MVGYHQKQFVCSFIYVPVSATRWGRQSRFASTMSSMASRSGREQKRPV